MPTNLGVCVNRLDRLHWFVCYRSRRTKDKVRFDGIYNREEIPIQFVQHVSDSFGARPEMLRGGASQLHRPQYVTGNKFMELERMNG